MLLQRRELGQYRPDSGKFPDSVKGSPLDPPFADELWLDIRSPVVRDLMKARLDLAVTRGCDGVEPDNVDGYSNDNGLKPPLTAAEQLDFNKFIAAEAHARALSVGLKNDLDQLGELVSHFDWALNEECFTYDECWFRAAGHATVPAMANAAAIQRMSASEYLAWERVQPAKHEYHLGEVFAMAGGSPRHNVLSTSMGAELRAAVRGKECHVLSPDQRISAKQGERYVYADAVVVCGALQTEPGTSDVLANPRVVVEVLSRSTEAYDRGEKWEAYQRLGSLTDYLLVAQGSVRIEHYQREDDGSWRYRVLSAGDTITLTNGATLSIDAVYEGAFELAAD